MCPHYGKLFLLVTGLLVGSLGAHSPELIVPTLIGIVSGLLIHGRNCSAP